MNYGNILHFKGTWRNYQARVLANAQEYIKDGKIHIVAAPGSGKTTLGIELIARMGETALVLAPSITIREQWAARIADGFLCEGLAAEDYISQDLKNPRCITIATYQALYSAMNKYKGIIVEAGTTVGSFETDDRLGNTKDEEEEVDYSAFDVVAEMKTAGIGVLCLDECHHLRSEWWRALEEFKQALGSVKLIALTATPPYDSTPAMWKRYMDMCGEIDEKITIPELVKEGSLCPHQDFVYFNYPTKEEREEITKFATRSAAMQRRLMEDENFLLALKTHRGLAGQMTSEELLEEGDYLSALLIFLNEKQVEIPKQLTRAAKMKSLPKLSVTWLETLLQGFLYDDIDSYACTEEYRQWLTNEIKAEGLIEKKKVTLATTDAVEKLLISSKGKCESIKEIVKSEYQNIGPNLRMLILTDYIRKEYEKCVGVPESDVTSLGVIPFFEQIRREGTIIRLGVLCGTIVIIPAEAKEALLTAVGDSGKVTFSSVGSLPETDYVKVTAVGDNHFLTQAVTDIFAKGCMQVLIGTKSLLGEGWDSPCINSLILASFVGSFMLSNQMRGRAIRVWKDNPQKTSNIWHLVCLMPEEGVYLPPDANQEESEDFVLLKRRMEHFLGLHYTEDVIENGIDRLSIIGKPYNEKHVAEMNEQTLALSRQRDTLKNRWNAALTKNSETQVIDTTEVDENIVSETSYKDNRKKLLYAGAGVAAGVALSFTPAGWLGGAVALASGAYGALKLRKTSKLKDPSERLKETGEKIYQALAGKNLLEDKNGKVEIGFGTKGRSEVFLNSTSGRDKLLFAQCVREFFSAVNDQRYLLVKAGKRDGDDGFYCVPECFAKKKEDAEYFYSCLAPCIGKYNPVYTRNEAGKEVLLEGRMKSLADAKERSRTKKTVKKQ